MKSIDIVISVEESENLERLNYCVEARANLLTRILQGVISPSNKDIVIDKYMKEYEEYFIKYERAKHELEKKYKPENAISWNLNFDTHVITFEVEDA